LLKHEKTEPSIGPGYLQPVSPLDAVVSPATNEERVSELARQEQQSDNSPGQSAAAAAGQEEVRQEDRPAHGSRALRPMRGLISRMAKKSKRWQSLGDEPIESAICKRGS